jgi:hypothetical protein
MRGCDWRIGASEYEWIADLDLPDRLAEHAGLQRFYVNDYVGQFWQCESLIYTFVIGS